MIGQFEDRDAPIKSVVATVSFPVEPQKPMGGMLPNFLAVRGASTASKRLLLDTKDHLRASAVYGSSPTFNFSPTYKIRWAAPPSTRWHALTRNKATAQLSDPLHRFCPHLFSLLLVTALMGNWKSYFHGSLCMCPSGKGYRTVHYASMYWTLFDQSD